MAAKRAKAATAGAQAERAASPPAWRSRIVGTGEEAPDQLLANPRNWRIHPKAQQDALAGILSEVGWVQNVIVNQRTGHVVDGHARVEIAISRGEASVPVVYVDLDENEEGIVLAALDPLAAMAVQDPQKWNELLAEISVTEDDLKTLLSPQRIVNNPAVAVPQLQQILVDCDTEDVQRELYERLREEGYTCRLLTL